MNNINPDTGVRYGVIALRSLDPDLAHDLWVGGVDNVYAGAYTEAKAEALHRLDLMYEDAEIAAAEVDGNMSAGDREDFIGRRVQAHLNSLGAVDEEDFIEMALDEFSDCFQTDMVNITGTYEGVDYMITELGGAELLWVLKGPIGGVRSLCSPCVPNAGDLDSGFEVGVTLGHECYVVPKSWLAKEEDPA